MLAKRLLSHKFKFDPNYTFKCGLEIHTQLKTKYKLFSLSKTGFNAAPNSNISYFDIAIPGTQPKLNPEALLLALKLSTALNCEIQSSSRFDRKHYFYPDQPLGYQITQFYHPLAKNGTIKLDAKLDNLPHDKTINITQIQIEQDTGKLTHEKESGIINIDYNRANIPLIELVTEPDFENLQQVKSFVKKYQSIIKHLDICTGDLETGAMRVDVNVSVNGGNRVEIKNLGSSGEIQDAIIYEYNRQVKQLKGGIVVDQETRGWNGQETVRSRSKEDAVDYRYFPDSELPVINLSPTIKDEIAAILPELPDRILLKLINKPYNLELRHAKFLLDNRDIFDYYQQLFDALVVGKKYPAKIVNNWLIHEYLGAFNKLKIPVDVSTVDSAKLSKLILLVVDETISNMAAKNIVIALIQDPSIDVDKFIKDNDLTKSNDGNSEVVTEVCQQIIKDNPEVVEKIKSGKKGSVNFLLGIAMKQTRGKVQSKLFLEKFNQLIN